MAVKTSNQHHIGQFQAQTGEGSAPHMCVPTQIQLQTVKIVEIGPESDVQGACQTLAVLSPLSAAASSKGGAML